MNVRFDPDAWKRAGEDMKEASQFFQQSAIDIQLAPSQGSKGGLGGLFEASPIDYTLASCDEKVSLAWYNVAGNMVEKLNSDAAKFIATGRNYQQREDGTEYAAGRYWSY